MRSPVHGAEEWLILAVIAYEVAAKASQYTPGPTLPTWTAMNQRRPLVGHVLIVGLHWHFRSRDT